MDQNIIHRTASMSNSPRQSKAKVIKRYGNRKLYDTEKSSYVVLNDIAKMIRNEEEVQIIDNETKDDITSATLIQIIFGSEKKASLPAPLHVLKSIIKKGDGSFSNYLSEIGVLKNQITDEEITIEEDEDEDEDESDTDDDDLYSSSANHQFHSPETLPERIVNAMKKNSSAENEKTILPGSNSNLVKEKEEEDKD